MLDAALGRATREAMLESASVPVPSGREMISEGEAARLHRLVRLRLDASEQILTAAGRGTADYILANRIPKPAQGLLQLLPAALAARALSRAIAANAWTFAGSGAFRAETPWTFALTANPLISGEHSDACLCQWHTAVFERLYTALVHPACHCREVACSAQGAPACRFHITRAR